MSQAPWNARSCGVSSCRSNRKQNGRQLISLQPPQLEEGEALSQPSPEDPKEGLTTEIEFFEPPLEASQNSSPLPSTDKDDYLHHPHEPVHHFIEVVEKEPTTDLAIGIWTARALLLLVAVLWGTNFASIKYLETLCFHPPCNHPPSEAALARFGVAAAVSLPLLYKQNKDVIFAGLECGLWISMGYIAQAMAETLNYMNNLCRIFYHVGGRACTFGGANLSVVNVHGTLTSGHWKSKTMLYKNNKILQEIRIRLKFVMVKCASI